MPWPGLCTLRSRPGGAGAAPGAGREDEAQRAAACVLAHVQAGRVPVALASTDRALVRRIGALLAGAHQPVRDENGWTLSPPGRLRRCWRRCAPVPGAPAPTPCSTGSSKCLPCPSSPSVRWRNGCAATPLPRGAMPWPAARLRHRPKWRPYWRRSSPAPPAACRFAPWPTGCRPASALQASGQWQPLASQRRWRARALELRLGDAADARTASLHNRNSAAKR